MRTELAISDDAGNGTGQYLVIYDVDPQAFLEADDEIPEVFGEFATLICDQCDLETGGRAISDIIVLRHEDDSEHHYGQRSGNPAHVPLHCEQERERPNADGKSQGVP